VALLAAGVYQLTPLKRACLRRCRSPLGFLRRHGRAGLVGAARTGVVHGAYCLGCCVGLMVVLFAVGVMSVAWMATVAAVILVEKMAPRGESLVGASSVALIAAGVWLAL
jgi:predicted metal-binding membrane protein